MGNEEIKTNKITGSSLLYAKCNKEVIWTLASMDKLAKAAGLSVDPLEDFLSYRPFSPDHWINK